MLRFAACSLSCVVCCWECCAVCCVLCLVDSCLLRVLRRLFYVVCYSLGVIVVRCMMSVICRVLSIVRRLLPVALAFAVCCMLLFVMCCLVCDVVCLSFAACLALLVVDVAFSRASFVACCPRCS